MSTLYEITSEYQALLDYADGTDLEDQKIFADTLESIQGELTVKADGYAAVIAEISGSIKKFDAEIKRLTARRDAMENSIKRMKETLFNAMKAMEMDEIKTDFHKFKICNNGGKQALEVTGEVPESYTKVIIEPDNDKIRAAIEAGEEITFAHLKERGQHLRIS